MTKIYYFEDYEMKPLNIILFMSNYTFLFGNRRKGVVVPFFVFHKIFFKPTYDEITDATFKVSWAFALFAFF